MVVCRDASSPARAARIDDGFAGADLASDHPEGAFADAPADPGGSFGVAGVAVQHLWGQGPPEGHAGEAVVGLEVVKAHECS